MAPLPWPNRPRIAYHSSAQHVCQPFWWPSVSGHPCRTLPCCIHVLASTVTFSIACMQAYSNGQRKIHFKLSNGVAAACYIHNETDLDTFVSTLSLTTAPWADFCSERYCAAVPRPVMDSLDFSDIEHMVAFWDGPIRRMDYLRARAPKDHREHISFDTQVRG